jgi:hypothetical protein
LALFIVRGISIALLEVYLTYLSLLITVGDQSIETQHLVKGVNKSMEMVNDWWLTDNFIPFVAYDCPRLNQTVLLVIPQKST